MGNEAPSITTSSILEDNTTEVSEQTGEAQDLVILAGSASSSNFVDIEEV